MAKLLFLWFCVDIIPLIIYLWTKTHAKYVVSFWKIIRNFEIKCAHIKSRKYFRTLYVSLFMVKYVCYDILELKIYGWHIYCNKSYICSTCTTFTILGRVWNLGGGATAGSGAQIGGKGLIAFRGRVRTNTTEVSTGWVKSSPLVFRRDNPDWKQ